MKSRVWQTILLLIAGILLGALAAELTQPIAALSFLSFGLDFGTAAPVTLHLGFMTLTAGIAVKITVSMVLFALLTVYFGRKIYK